MNKEFVMIWKSLDERKRRLLLDAAKKLREAERKEQKQQVATKS